MSLISVRRFNTVAVPRLPAERLERSENQKPYTYLTYCLRFCAAPESLGRVAQVLPLQEQVDLVEVGPVRLVPLPALAHQVVYLLRATDGHVRENLEAT